MTEAEVVRIMREHLEGLFPKVCATCYRRFATLREYLLTTTHLGPAIPYDVELGDWKPLRPLGTMTYANCPCGSNTNERVDYRGGGGKPKHIKSWRRTLASPQFPMTLIFASPIFLQSINLTCNKCCHVASDISDICLL